MSQPLEIIVSMVSQDINAGQSAGTSARFSLILVPPPSKILVSLEQDRVKVYLG
jgi:hypothetical protein